MKNNIDLTNNEDLQQKLKEAKADYEAQNASEPVNEESLKEARENLIKIISQRIPASARGSIEQSIVPTVYTLNESDCIAMAELIKKKGLMRAFAMAKKKTKKK